jgi:hypothetical protein
MTVMFRQGDILIKKITKIPKSATKRKNNVILEGEKTGHAHRLNQGSVFEYGPTIYLEALEDASITHDEHMTIPLEKGLYQVVRQREADHVGGSLRDWSYTKD